MTFTELCDDMAVTPDERMRLARYLATFRAEETLKLGMVCPRCKVDRFKEPCPGPHSECPVLGEAYAAQPPASTLAEDEGAKKGAEHG